MSITGLESWKTFPHAGTVADPGNSVDYLTGEWRTRRPVVDLEKCTHCMICWVFCPDGTIQSEDGRFLGFDLEHCKGCGICAVECPPKAIAMTDEAEAALKGAV